jgi:hypothetical protein
MSMNVWKIAGTALLLACAAGCRTTKDVLDDYEKAISVGQYSAPVEETTELAVKGDDSRLLWQLLSGAASYMADDKSGARQMFDAAEDTFAKNDQKSVFTQGGQGALAMMTNDRAFPYDGGGQDRIFTCLYKAIDFMATRDADAARVELNRVARYQANWLYDRRRDIDAAARKMESDANAYAKQQQVAQQGNRSQQVSGVLRDASFGAQIKGKCGFDPATSGNLNVLAPKDYMNVYAEHVTGVFRWLNGDSDLNYLRDVAALAARNPVATRDYQEQCRGGRPANQVWIYAEDGLCPCREEWRLDLPLGLLPFVRNYVIYAGMALPYLRERAHGAISWSVAANGATVPMSQLADMDALVKTEYDVYMRGALTREITRTIVKIGAQVALGVAADAAARRHDKKGSSSADFWALKAAQIGAATWAATTTAADLRSWTALPKTVKVARVARPADGKLEVVADGQRIPLSIPPGNTMVFIRKPGPTAYPVVKMATF